MPIAISADCCITSWLWDGHNCPSARHLVPAQQENEPVTASGKTAMLQSLYIQFWVGRSCLVKRFEWTKSCLQECIKIWDLLSKPWHEKHRLVYHLLTACLASQPSTCCRTSFPPASKARNHTMLLGPAQFPKSHKHQTAKRNTNRWSVTPTQTAPPVIWNFTASRGAGRHVFTGSCAPARNQLAACSYFLKVRCQKLAGCTNAIGKWKA